MQLYNTLARDLAELPEPPGPIGMYVCGPTVYARAHIGNARPFVLASWYARWLRVRGYDVTLVHNITDVNDKIYEAAPGASAERARQATEWYLEDTGRFGLDEVDHWPKVTETMDEIVAFIADLVERGFAYEVDGDVYFRVARLAEYGRLSGQQPDQVEEQEPNPRKEDPRDFALWKANKPDEDTWWDSPWGRGRPGWHIECSAMAEKLLGPVFEIHGGGLDLVFPHHENELAQSRARGHEFAKVWMHNGMLRFTGEKMSKSVGNVETIAEALDRWGPETSLLFFLTAHWRSPIDFSDETHGRRAGTRRGAARGVPEPVGAGRARCLGALPGGARRRLLDTPPRSRSCTSGATTSCCAGRSTSSGSRGWPSRRTRRRRCTRWPPAAQEARAAKDFARADRAARADRGGRVGRARRLRRLSPRSQAVTRDQVYGRRPVREALRGRRQVLEVWATERAVASEPWLRGGSAPPDQAGSGDRRGRRHARPPGCARLDRAVPLRRRLRARGRRAAAPRLPRPGHRSAQPRRGDPQRRGRRRDRRRRARARLGDGDRRGRPRVGRRGRAPAGRRRPEPRALPERDQARRPLDLRGGRRRASRTSGRRISPAAWRSSSAPRARACARSSGARATRRSRSRSPGTSSRSTSASPRPCSSTRRRRRRDG